MTDGLELFSKPVSVFRQRVAGKKNPGAPFGLQRVIAENPVVLKIAERSVAGGIELPDAHVSRFQGKIEPLFAGLYGVFRALAIGDIAQ